MDDVEKLWRDRNRQSERLQKFGADAGSFLEKITGSTTGVAPRDKGYQKRMMKGYLAKRGIYDGDMVATPAQVALKKKKDAKAKVAEAKRKEKRQRGSKTLKKRKSEVPEYLQQLQMNKKYRKGFKILFTYFDEMRGYDNDLRIKRVEAKLAKLGLI